MEKQIFARTGLELSVLGFGCCAVGGLMVRDRDGHWRDAPVIPDAFVCNIGDCLMRWTNDVYVSTPHRVVSPRGRDRYSVVFFLDPNPEAVVACLRSPARVYLTPYAVDERAVQPLAA